MTLRIVGLFVALTALAACSEPKDPVAPPPPPRTPASSPAASPTSSPAVASADAEAATLFKTRCAPCHGMTGGGDGPVAANLAPKPRTFADREWQSGVTDAYLEKVILEGGGALGKSPIMPASPDLADRPAVVQGLRAIVRAFAQPAG